MEDEDFPPVGLTGFDLWMHKLYIYMFGIKFLDIVEYGILDREHFKQYYEDGYTVQEAFEEDATTYGD